jgi:diguanylate cyclase (GGDEF)-like protein
MVRARRSNGRRQAVHDPLTGLPGRAAVETYVAARVAQGAVGFAVAVLDVNGFRQINAALGYAAGDRVLVEVARRLAARGPALLARLGADRFAAVVAGGSAGVAEAETAALVAAVRGPITVDRLPLELGLAAGVATFPGHGDDAETLLRRAEQAMRVAKRRGDGEVGVPAGGVGTGPEYLRRLADLRHAVCDPTDQNIQLYYQPQVDPRTGGVVGAEALPRWHISGRSPLDPVELLRNADAADLLGPVPRLLATRVLDDVIAQMARWGDTVGDLRISVNVTMHDLTGSDLVDRLADRLVERNVPASRLQLEITEGSVPAEPRAGGAAVRRQRRLGVALALDHFGTGTASLALLRRLPLAEVKIDRSFVLGAADGGPDAAVVRAVTGLAAELGLRAVADGVEDERTWRALARAGCVLQGWYCARPMPAERLVNWLALYRNRLRPQLT